MAIKSSAINDVMVDGDDLVVEFKGGNMYRYAGAGKLEGDLRSAPSAGRFFQSSIRGKFSASRV